MYLSWDIFLIMKRLILELEPLIQHTVLLFCISQKQTFSEEPNKLNKNAFSKFNTESLVDTNVSFHSP